MRSLSLAAALLLCAAVPLSAQRVTVSGQVLDTDSGQPIAGAIVEVGERGGPHAITDAEGRFTFRVRAGERALTAHALGYEMAVSAIDFTGQTMELDVGLKPQPVVLDAVTVVVDRFEHRRRAVAVSSRVMDVRQIAGAAAMNAFDLLETRLSVHALPCPGSVRANCVRARGSVVAPTIYVDEARFMGDLDALRSFDTSEVYRIEVYSGGSHIRVYTRWYMNIAAKSRLRPMPLPIT
ncbi:MAG TPA: carboxypeptidase-like regulatory domain-containing protein [Longimicrobium sp.]|nr:carboxypeptidase-like regulatory domain-containing protein [Longimicrobium sp.]